MIDAARYLNEQARYGGWSTPAAPDPDADRRLHLDAQRRGAEPAIRDFPDQVEPPFRQHGWIAVTVFVIAAFLAGLLTAGLTIGLRGTRGASAAGASSAAAVMAQGATLHRVTVAAPTR